MNESLHPCTPFSNMLRCFRMEKNLNDGKYFGTDVVCVNAHMDLLQQTNSISGEFT